MSAIAGIVNLRKKTDCETENIRNMVNVLSHRGKNIQKIKRSGQGIFGCAPFEYLEDKERQIPFSLKAEEAEFTICFDGLIYNSDELKGCLSLKNPVTDAELVLKAYIRWGAGCLKHLNGIFAFSVWNSNNNELFLARDRFGIKPLYYTVFDDTLIFASEIKGILAHPSVCAVLDKSGICQILGLGPAQIPGSGIFEGINEVKPAHFLVFNEKGCHSNAYWYLNSLPYEKDFEECVCDVKRLTTDSINSQLSTKGRDMCFFLSGGLDSSIITALAAKNYGKGINTFSLKYKGNDDFFTPTEYQPTSDDYYINLMSETFDTNHHTVTVDNESLIDLLYDSMKARDLPGMADVDSSLYFLCKEMGSDFSGALSGECADEVFGGYPWFHRKEDFDADIFPWAKNIDLRRSLVSPEVMSENYISDYIYDQYKKSIAMCPKLLDEPKEEERRREISYLNLNWFMYTLGARSERIGMNQGLEIRMPFCDYKLVEYMWNVPWKFKAYNEREKGLLRVCFEDILPEEVLWRKKSPFPKTHNPEYEMMIKNELEAVLNDKNSPVLELLNEEYIRNLLKQPSDYGKPWFGQLMALPQLYSYILQANMWLKEYRVKIKF